MSNMKTEEDLSFQKAKDLALRYLSYKSRTEKEVVDRLRKDDYSEDTIDKTLLLLKKYNYINDENFAEAFALSKSNYNLDGSYKIKQQLKQKGIKFDDFNSLGIDETMNAVVLIRKKCKNPSHMELREKQKIFAFLARKGYPLNVINEAFKRVDSSIDIEWD